MDATIKLENIIDAFNINFKVMYPDSNGIFILKKSTDKGIFGAIKTFKAEVFFVNHSINSSPELVIQSNITSPTASNLEENMIWKEVAIMLTSQLFGFINYIHLDKYGYRS